MSIQRQLELTTLLHKTYGVPMKIINEIRREVISDHPVPRCLICTAVAAVVAGPGTVTAKYASPRQHDLLSGHEWWAS